jgi:2-amino-4-hydroxy-6-hydroxymethyldihydropteridine diphosphokinase
LSRRVRKQLRARHAVAGGDVVGARRRRREPSVQTRVWIPAYVALGSNLDDPQRQVTAALAALAQLTHCRLVATSRLYRTAPLGPQDQPEFVNAVAGLLTTSSARALLDQLKELERSLGRERPAVRWGPRRIDLDLLVYGSERISETGLTVPHPGVPQRNFVLYPLRDIAPDLYVPGHGTVHELAARVGSSGLALLQ